MPFDTGAYLGAVGQGNAALAGGISSFGKDAGEAITQYKQLQAAGKAADYFRKSMDDPSQMGITDAEWQTLGARDKAAAAQGFMQKQTAQQEQAKADEARARARFMQQQADEGDAMGAIAPAALNWQQQNPGKQPGPADIMGWMKDTGPMNPKVQATLMRSIIPKIMAGGDPTDNAPVPYDSPQGNHYIRFGKTFLPDRAPAEADAATPPEGYAAVSDGKGGVKYLKQPDTTRKLPPTFEPQMNAISKTVADAQTTLAQPDADFQSPTIAKMAKTNAKNKLASAQKQGQSLLDRHLKMGNLTPDEHASMYEDLGLTPPAASSTPAASSSAGNSGGAAASSSDRITVQDKNGQKFTVPSSQADAAKKAGYQIVPTL